jgi:hypothetical protein
MILLCDRPLALIGILAAIPPFAHAEEYTNEMLRRDLLSTDPRVYAAATENAAALPTPETVRDLMAVVLSKDFRPRSSPRASDVIYEPPLYYAILALSRILENPPTTFGPQSESGRMSGWIVYYQERWGIWWEANHQTFEGPDAHMPERREDSLWNQSEFARERRESEEETESRRLSDEWVEYMPTSRSRDHYMMMEEFLELRRQARQQAALVPKAGPPLIFSPWLFIILIPLFAIGLAVVLNYYRQSLRKKRSLANRSSIPHHPRYKAPQQLAVLAFEDLRRRP